MVGWLDVYGCERALDIAICGRIQIKMKKVTSHRSIPSLNQVNQRRNPSGQLSNIV
jgi:hypothetical protein